MRTMSDGEGFTHGQGAKDASVQLEGWKSFQVQLLRIRHYNECFIIEREYGVSRKKFDQG